MRRLICHFIDSSVGSNYFVSLTRHQDHSHYPLMIGSLAPAGGLQRAMREAATPTFALGLTVKRQYLSAIARLARLLRRQHVAVLHAHCFDPTLIGLFAARLAGVPFVFSRHHYDPHIRGHKRGHQFVDSWCARHADKALAVSAATRRLMIEVEGVPASQIEVVYNGVEPLRQPTAESLSALRQELDLPAQPVCLMVARLHEEKGHRYLFEALPLIMKKTGPLTVLLAGGGGERAALEQEVQHRGLTAQVRFLGPRHDIPELLSLANVVTQPSISESFGIAPLEAMGFGKPVVASDVGGLPEVVLDGVTGLLVPPGNPAALAEALARVLQDPQLAQRLGAGGRRHAATFSFERMMRHHEKIYDAVLTRAAPPKTVTSTTVPAPRPDSL